MSRLTHQPSEPADSLVESWRPRVWLGGHRYRVLGRLALGESADAFLAMRDHRLTEREVAKLHREDADREQFAAGRAALHTGHDLRAAGRGASHLPSGSGAERTSRAGGCRGRGMGLRSAAPPVVHVSWRRPRELAAQAARAA